MPKRGDQLDLIEDYELARMLEFYGGAVTVAYDDLTHDRRRRLWDYMTWRLTPEETSAETP